MRARDGRPSAAAISAGSPSTRGDHPGVDLLDLERGLEALAALDPRQAHIVELRFFGGLTIRETATAVGVSHTIVEREWSLARAWLRRELARASGS